MTAEIGIMNRSAIALATDSAVTFDTEAERKIYNSANKLFRLSKYHPIGIMIYGNAEFMGIPWETIIKMYRSEINGKSFDTLEEYCKNFIEYIKNFPYTDIDKDMYYQSSIANCFHDIYHAFKQEKEDCINEEWNAKQSTAFMREIIKGHWEKWKEAGYIEGFSDEFVEEFIEMYKNDINHLIESYFKQFNLTKDNKYKLQQIGAYVLSKNIFSYAHTGVVVAGFGEKDIFPKIFSYKFDGITNKLLKYELNKAISAENTSAAIVPFAQSEMVFTFLNGIDPALERIYDKAFYTALQKFSQFILNLLFSKADGTNVEELKSNFEHKLDDMSSTILKEHSVKMQKTREELFWNSIMDIVSVLPKDELAAMAETFVNLTSFKRKVTNMAETVGGPIDVAVISKGDGFIWIKRKHYFDPRLNSQFFVNYNRGDNYE